MDTVALPTSLSNPHLGVNYSSPSYRACSSAARATPQSVPRSDPMNLTVPPPRPKQSKSRNGCVTCKAKRLKCDETKPTCQQCHKRGVQCGGYKKDFKWRPFEESSIAGKSGRLAKKGSSTPKTKSPSPPRSLFAAASASVTSSPEPPTQGIANYSNPKGAQASVPAVPGAIAPTIKGIEAEMIGTLISAGLSFAPRPELEDLNRGIFATRSTDVLDVSFMELGAKLASEGVADDTEIIQQTDSEADANHEMAVNGFLTMSELRPRHTEGHLGSALDVFRRPATTVDSPEILLSHFDKHTCGIMSMKDGPTENPWRTIIWPIARDSPALYHAISAMTAFHMSRQRRQLRVAGMEHMRKSIRFLAQGLSHGNIREEAALGTTLVLAFSEAFDRHISTGIEHLRGAKVLLNQTLAKLSSTRDVTVVPAFQFLYNVWIYLDVLARLTSKDEDENHARGGHNQLTHQPLLARGQIDPLLGCAATLFPLIGRAAAIGQRVRNSDRSSINLIADAAEVQSHLQAWAVDDYYDPLEDVSNDVQHCTRTAEAYRWATLLFLHQAVPELPSPTSHELAEKVMVLLASIPLSSRSCIVHIFPLLAAGCEATSAGEREWVRKRWEGMTNRMWIGNVEKAWTVTQEVWERRDRHRVRSRKYGSPSSNVSTPRVIASEFGENDIFDWDSTSLIVGETSLRGLPPQDSGLLGEGRDSETDQHYLRNAPEDAASMPIEFTLRGGLHWIGVMKDWQWEVLLG